MNAYNIYTRKSLGLDNRIWRTLFSLALLSAGLLGFRMATDVPCMPITIDVDGFTSGMDNSFYLGQNITFTAKMKEGKEVMWDFGDHTPPVKGKRALHTYNLEGNYFVTATVNGKCTESISIIIRQLTTSPVVTGIDASKILITGPDAAFTAAPVTFNTSTNAQSYEWTVLNSPEFPAQAGPMATFIFPTPGTRIIQLKLNNDPNRVDRKQIQVLQGAAQAAPAGSYAPPPQMGGGGGGGTPMPNVSGENEGGGHQEGAEAPKVLVIPDEEFKSLLEQATQGREDAQSFNQFLCSGGQTKALVNGKESLNFSDLMGRIHGNKKYVIRSVETIRNDKNCVMLIKVEYKKKGILGL